MRNITAELICTRISHDIMGSIGAACNASELLEEGDMDFMDDIKAILKTSSSALAARMKFFRMAFGLDNSNLQDLNMAEKCTRDYLLSLGNKDFPIVAEFGWQTGDDVRSAMIMAMIMADVLVRGGKIRLLSQGGILAAETDKSAKISADKFNKLLAVLEGRDAGEEANLAPLKFLLELKGADNVRMDEDATSYRLMAR
ncbi:MAG: hypothetical protein IJ184_02785 [Alphaproteobacteria bacterium]|nr:hypothetical protein [Alphaproteobacteria bacterium]